MACNYEYVKTCHFCGIAAGKAQLLQDKMLLKPLMILSFTLHRVSAGSLTPDTHLIDFPETMDMKRICCGWSNQSSLIYSLFGWISWVGRSTDSGHYTVYLRKDANNVFVINDSVVQTMRLKQALGSPQVKRSVRMLFYVRNDCLRRRYQDHS